MKGLGIEIVKDLIISILIVACIGIILSIIFYDDIAIGKVIPEAEEYVLSSEMKEELKNSELDDAQEVVINYYIDAADLKKYEKTNEYVKGKNNPFAEVSDDYTSDENTVAGSDNSTTSGTNNNNSGNGGFYEDDGTK